MIWGMSTRQNEDKRLWMNAQYSCNIKFMRINIDQSLEMKNYKRLTNILHELLVRED